ncbi:MAG: J domain-containing protein [Elainellaceae cyanobacterium]
MSSKSLKAKITLTAECVEDAIVYLSERFLRLTKAGCRVVRTQSDESEFCLAQICQPLVTGWIEARVAYAPGNIVLLFRSGELTPEADLLIYTPDEGDRFLYTKPHPANVQNVPNGSHPGNAAPVPSTPIPLNGAIAEALQTTSQRLDQLAAQQRSLEEGLQQWMAQSAQTIAQSDTQSTARRADALTERVGDGGDRSTGNALPASLPKILDLQANRMESAIAQALTLYTHQLNQQIGQQIKQQVTTALDHQLEAIRQTISIEMRQQLQPLQQQIDALQQQLADLAADVQVLEQHDEDTIPLPQTPGEWRTYIHDHWGTVGDYERYSSSYREANAATPLHPPPDWIVLCELDWARELSPTLADLYRLIHGPGGIGDEGADILQQFGRHLDAETGKPYYLYQLGGYTPYEALWQIAYNPSHSWLPELQRLWQRLQQANHPIFQLLGWEPEAIAALQRIVNSEAAGHQSTSSRSSQSTSSRSANAYQAPPRTSAKGTTLRDYQAVLNLGPFTPITIESIKRAYRQAMKAAHPDSGGSTELAQRVNEAYEAVMRHYFPEAT